MKIGNVDVKVSILAIAVFVIFTILVIIASIYSPVVRSQLIWLIPVLFMLIILPVALNYMSQRQYADLRPEYERQAKTTRIRLINESMVGKIVRVEGVVERAHFQFLNRPQYSVADRSGAVTVKMFTSPEEDIRVNDIVEVLGQVIKRYIVTGDPVINAVSIRKTGSTKKQDE
jgi:hypothetical protein